MDIKKYIDNQIENIVAEGLIPTAIVFIQTEDMETFKSELKNLLSDKIPEGIKVTPTHYRDLPIITTYQTGTLRLNTGSDIVTCLFPIQVTTDQ